jgi:hypothetical protein
VSSSEATQQDPKTRVIHAVTSKDPVMILITFISFSSAYPVFTDFLTEHDLAESDMSRVVLKMGLELVSFIAILRASAFFTSFYRAQAIKTC